MTFFLIVPSVIVLSIVLVRSVASYIGLEIRYATLFLCAVLAFVALFVAMKFSANINSSFFVRLGVMVAFGAALLTALNQFLILREEDGEADFTEEVRREYAKSTDKKISAEGLPSLNLRLQKSSKVDTLEELVEYANTEKESGDISEAIDAYQKILETYPEDGYAPFAAIDLGAIYREQAAYTKAIKVYEEALTLAAVKRNAAVEKEFSEKLDYIKAVQTVLFRHRALSTPFSQIPEEYLREVELELNSNAEML